MRSRTRHRFPAGFSILELLFVMTIIGVLLFLSMGTLFPLAKSLSLTEGGESVAELILEARQQAVAKSSAVELRLYDLTSEDDDDIVTTIQLVVQRNDGTYQASNPLLITGGVGISRDPRLTSFFHSSRAAEKLIRGQAGKALPGDSEATFVGFRFHPDGSTNLPDHKWFLTLLAESEVDGPIPENFFTIQIDPLLGQIQVFRP